MGADDYAVIEVLRRVGRSPKTIGVLWVGGGGVGGGGGVPRRDIALLEDGGGVYPGGRELPFGFGRNPPHPKGPPVGVGKGSGGGSGNRKGVGVANRIGEAITPLSRAPMGLANGHTGLAGALSRRGKPTEAEAEYHAAVTILGKVVVNDPKVLFYRVVLAVGLNNFGGFLLKLGRSAEALDAYGRAFTLLEQLIKENPADQGHPTNGGRSLVGRGRARRALGDPAGAAADVRQALRLFEGLRLPEGEAAFAIACRHAALAGLAGQEGTGVSAAEGKAHADQAMALLRKAVNGFRFIPDLSHRGCPRPAPRAGGLQEAARRLEQKSAARPK